VFSCQCLHDEHRDKVDRFWVHIYFLMPNFILQFATYCKTSDFHWLLLSNKYLRTNFGCLFGSTYFYGDFNISSPTINRIGLPGLPLSLQYNGSNAFSKTDQSILFSKTNKGCFWSKVLSKEKNKLV